MRVQLHSRATLYTTLLQSFDKGAYVSDENLSCENQVEQQLTEEAQQEKAQQVEIERAEAFWDNWTEVNQADKPWKIAELAHARGPRQFHPISSFGEAGRQLNIPRNTTRAALADSFVEDVLFSINYSPNKGRGPQRLKNALVILDWVYDTRAASHTAIAQQPLQLNDRMKV